MKQVVGEAHTIDYKSYSVYYQKNLSVHRKWFSDFVGPSLYVKYGIKNVLQRQTFIFHE